MFIKSPINYTGNKYRLLEQFSKYLPNDTDLFVDLFCGGATVGFNVNAKKIVLIDSNERIINLLKTLAEKDIKKIIGEIEKLIELYNLSYSYKYTYKYYRELGYVEGNNGIKKYNYEGFQKLKKDYNALKNKNTFIANIMLYTLMVYGFNNDIRFNRYGEFNLPVGKTDFNRNNYEKLIAYNNRAKEINYEFICGDFREEKIRDILYNANFVYCDPPYLITDAVYNECNGRSEKEENDLLNLLTELHKMGKSFALSNVMQKKGAKNDLLISWTKINKYKKHDIDYHYRSASYNKKDRDGNEEEVLITNK